MRKRIPKILVTGGAGFIGSAFVRNLARNGQESVMVDALTYAGDIKRIEGAKGKCLFSRTDIRDQKKLKEIFKKEKPEVVVNFAAETHVDRSILDSRPFIQTNCLGTQNLLDLSRHYGIRKFIHISTDEVYGEINKGHFTEDSPLKPNSPYAASKASADLLIKSYIRTYGFPAIIIRPCNNYGPWQYPEKLIPVVIFKALKGKKVPIYGKGQNVREWLYVSDCAEAIYTVLKKGKVGEIYNIGSGEEKINIEVARLVLDILGKPEGLIQFVEDRPGHDYRYSLDFSKISRLGWKPDTGFKKGISKTVYWYTQNFSWLESKVNYLHRYWKKVYK